MNYQSFQNLYISKLVSSNDTKHSVGLRHPINSILKPEKDLYYFEELLFLKILLTQNRIFENISVS